ncbi:alpha/beta hydrolase [Streptomyces bambusae]
MTDDERTGARRPRGGGRGARGLGVVLASACLLGGLVPGATSAAHATRNGTDPALSRYHHQVLGWHSCVRGAADEVGRALEKAGARCAEVTVPLDYAEPGGLTTTVAIARISAPDTRRRIGPLLVNPGGPGAPALGLAAFVHAALGSVAARYDVIGMDPRFVGRSTPLDCGWPTGTVIRGAGLTRAAFERQVAFHRDLVARCRTRNGPLLPHVTTRNTARDMDVVRAVLGAPKLSYLGYSYGTYLGTVYTQMFPGHYDRVVLDSALDPVRYGPRMLRDTLPANERALAAWAGWAARRHGTYRLGRTRAQVLAAVDRFLRTADRRPLAVGSAPETYRVDSTHIPFLVLSGIADDTDAARAEFSGQMSVLADAAAGRPPRRLSPQFTELLRIILTGERSHYGSVQAALVCGDKPAPRNPEHYWRNVERSLAARPLFGPLSHAIGPCAFWDRPREEPTRVTHDTPALILAATGDPRTPYEGNVALHRMLPASRLITLRDTIRHGVYGVSGSACADALVNSYLNTGTLPAGDRTCSRPDAGGGGDRRAVLRPTQPSVCRKACTEGEFPRRSGAVPCRMSSRRTVPSPPMNSACGEGSRSGRTARSKRSGRSARRSPGASRDSPRPSGACRRAAPPGPCATCSGTCAW